MKRALEVAAPLSLALLALAVRALDWPAVLGQQAVRFRGNDAYYHLRRIVYGLERFPRLPDFDPYLNYPEGARAIWPLAFDRAIVWLLKPFHGGGPGALARVEWLAAWIPPLLGAATVVLLYRFAKRFFGTPVALVAGLILSVLQGHVWYSQLGFVDHHVAEALLSTASIAACAGLLARLADARAAHRPAHRSAAATGLLLGLGLLVWPGSLLNVILIELVLLTWLLARPTRREAARGAGLLALLNAAALLPLLPSASTADWPRWGSFSPLVLSWFQPVSFAAAAAAAWACSVLWSRTGVGRTPRARGTQLVCVMLGLALSALLFAEVRTGIDEAWTWLSREETFQAMVAESRPLLGPGGAELAQLWLSRFVWVFPFAALLMARSAGGRPERAAIWGVVAWSLGQGLATCLQSRFHNSFSVALALAMGWSCVGLTRWLARSMGSARHARLACSAAVTALAVWMLWPSLREHRLPLQDLADGLRGREVFPYTRRPATVALLEAAGWMRANTPETSGWLDTSVKPEYGVMCDWADGHVIQYVARRPTVVDNFGDDIGRENFALSLQYFAARAEPPAAEILDRLGVRYVVSRGSPEAGTLGAQLNHGSGLARHRLLFESSAVPGRVPPGVVRVYELVRGAQLVGRAAPGAMVSARLPLATNAGRSATYEIAAQADAGGTYRLLLPYSNRGAPGAVRPGERYTLTAGGRTEAVVLDEQQVREGTRLQGPDLAPR